MSNHELGIYIRLLCYSWEHNHLPNDLSLLCKLVGGEPIPQCVVAKFKIDGDRLYNERMEKERAKLLGDNPGLNPKLTQPLPIAIPSSLQCDGFPEIWADYEGHRIERNEPLTSYTRKQLFLKCERLGAKKSVEMIRQTIQLSRKSLYEPHELNGFSGKPLAEDPKKETLTDRWRKANSGLTFNQWREREKV